MRHIIRSRPTLTHIFPRTMKVMPPNILFSSASTCRPSAARTRLTRSSSAAIVHLVSFTQNECRYCVQKVFRAFDEWKVSHSFHDVKRRRGKPVGQPFHIRLVAVFAPGDQQRWNLERPHSAAEIVIGELTSKSRAIGHR